MRRFDTPNINTREYWDAWHAAHATISLVATLRQDVYLDLLKGKRSVVELGCGLSPFCLMAAAHRMSATGLDLSETAVAFLKRYAPHVMWHQGDALHTPFHAAEFDGVVSGELIEHLEDPDALLAEMWRICVPGGRMVLSTPVLEFRDPEHLWEFDEAWFTARGFETRRVDSLKFPGRSYIFAWKDRT